MTNALLAIAIEALFSIALMLGVVANEVHDVSRQLQAAPSSLERINSSVILHR